VAAGHAGLGADVADRIVEAALDAAEVDTVGIGEGELVDLVAQLGGERP